MSMDGVLKLYFGESNLPTPEFIKRAPKKPWRMASRSTPRMPVCLRLRKALARYYQELHAVEIDPASEIVVTASGVQALHLAIRCVLDPGDEALVLTPAWPNGAANVAMANAVPIEIAQPLVAIGTNRLFGPRSRRHSAHADAALYFTIQSVGLGGHVGRATPIIGICAPPRIVAHGRRSIRAAELHGTQANYARADHFESLPLATTP